MRIERSNLISGLIGSVIGGFVIGMSVFVFVGRFEYVSESQDQRFSNEERKRDTTAITPRFPEDTKLDLASYVRVQSIQDIAQLDSDFDRNTSLHLLLSRADVDEIERYIHQSMSIPSKNQRDSVLSTIFGRYASVDPNRALERVLALSQLDMSEKSNLIRSSFHEWSLLNFSEAVAAIDALPLRFQEVAAETIMVRSEGLALQQRVELARRIGPNNDWIYRTVNAIRRSVYREDPRRAFYTRISETSLPSEMLGDLTSIAEYWYERDGVGILAEINESISNAVTRKLVLQGVIREAIYTQKADPLLVLDAVLAFPNKKDVEAAAESVFSNWSRSEPRRAFEMSLQYDHVVTREFRSTLLWKWASEYPEDVLTEVDGSLADFRDRDIAIGWALAQITRDSPEAAIRLAGKLDTPAMRVKAGDQIIQQWAEYDAESAFEWFIEHSDEKNVSYSDSSLLYAFTSYLRQNFESARDYANQHEGRLKRRLVNQVARHLVYSDLNLAIDYLPNVDTESRTWLLDEIGWQLATQDPIKALDLGKTIDHRHRESFYDSLLTAWASDDADTLLDSIKRVPRVYRSKAAEALIRVHEREQNLSNRDIRVLNAIVAEHGAGPP
ncbi:MAG: hypothetical protein OXG15_00985 [Gammaproteobacteria bacterium]|nr:hypothetical protein [Gammaproteobacteria bacterium]